MFIKAPNARAGTGYTGDVNTAFRQGRQDAFRDYIDNFNFALGADIKNNAENQRQVELAARNYGLNLQFDNATRENMIDTVSDSQKLANTVYEFDVDRNRLDSLYPQAQALGQSQAAQTVNTQMQAETDSAYNAGRSNIKFDNLEREGAGYKATVDNAATQAEMTQRSLVEKQNLYNNLVKRSDADWERAFAADMVRQYRTANPDSTVTDSDIMDELRRTGNYETAFQQYQQDAFRTARNEVNAAAGNVDKVVAPGETTNKSGQVTTQGDEKINYGKTENLDADKLATINGGSSIGFTQDGLEVVALPGGDVLLRGKNGGRLLGATTVNGRVLSPEENLRYRNIRYGADNHITTQDSLED